MRQTTLAEYKAQVDAKYAGMREQQIAKQEADRPRKDHWLLVGPDGQIDGVTTNRWCHSAAQAFEVFFPGKKERHKASADGWHIEVDDERGSRWAAECAQPESQSS